MSRDINNDDSPKSKQLAEMAFSTAFKQKRLPVADTNSSASDASIDDLISRFEQAAQVDEDGVNYWYGRDLQKLLGYLEYRNFQPVIQKGDGSL